MKQNLIGKTFGRLKVIAKDESRPYAVICECECGNRVSVLDFNLTKKTSPTRSCGCLQREIMRVIGGRTIRTNSAKLIEANSRYGTNFAIIEHDTPSKSNKSGYKGVWYNPVTRRYQAYISLRYKRIHLGCFEKLDDAVRARKAAEDELYAPLIAAKREATYSCNTAIAG